VDIANSADNPNPEDLSAPQAAGTSPDENLALERLKQRSTPAMFIVGADNKVLYANREALNIFKDPNGIPKKIQGFCRRIRARAADAPFDTSGMDCAVFKGPGNKLYSFRGFLMQGKENTPCHVMVLVEDAAERSSINLTKARNKFRLSEREIDVVNLLAQGLCNKEIGAKLFVSEHTVKGHLKNITRSQRGISRKYNRDSKVNVSLPEI
jgi:DNA-binding CsgD family transcriptional regulator